MFSYPRIGCRIECVYLKCVKLIFSPIKNRTHGNRYHTHTCLSCRGLLRFFLQTAAPESADPYSRCGDEYNRCPASVIHGEVRLFSLWFCTRTVLSGPEPGGETRLLSRVSGDRTIWHQHGTGILTLKVLNFWKFTSCCSLKPLWSGMGEVVPARTSPTLHPPSPPTVHQLPGLALQELTHTYSCKLLEYV